MSDDSVSPLSLSPDPRESPELLDPVQNGTGPLDFSIKRRLLAGSQKVGNQSPLLNDHSACETRPLAPFMHESGRSAFQAVPQNGLWPLPPMLNPALIAAATGILPGFPQTACSLLPPVPAPPMPFDFTHSATLARPCLAKNGSMSIADSAHGHQPLRPQAPSTQQLQPATKSSRPFKVYNPLDPLSALQVQAATSQSLASSSPSSPAPGSENLYLLYRQYLLNAQAALLRARTNGTTAQAVPDPDTNGRQSPVTPSPQQVTSTSDPHTEEVDPSHADGPANGQDSASTSIHQESMPTVASLPKAPCKPDVEAAMQKSLISQPPQEQGSIGGQDSEKRRSTGRSLPEDAKDDAYWERRRKNNEAAKRSRDARRQKEDEIAMKAALLEQENLRLRLEVAQLKAETERLRQTLLDA